MRLLLLSVLICFNCYAQNSNKKIEIQLMNCFEGSEQDVKRDMSEYLAVYEKEKYTVTNFTIKKHNIDSTIQPRFLIKGLASIKSKTEGRWINRKMYPGETVSFFLDNTENESSSRVYHIYIRGKLVETENNKFPYFKSIKDYELRVASGKKNESIIKMDVAAFSSGGFEGGIYVYWIGDLNGDNRLDMLVGKSNHYAGIELIFYVSDASDKKLFTKHKVGACSSC